MDDSSDGRAVALYPADPGSNPRLKKKKKKKKNLEDSNH